MRALWLRVGIWLVVASGWGYFATTDHGERLWANIALAALALLAGVWEAGRAWRRRRGVQS
jgi:hypothetical protein